MSLSSGPDLLEAQSTRKWVRRPFPQFWRPRKTMDDLIQIAGDLLGLRGKSSLRSQWRRRQQTRGSRDPFYNYGR
jgi:hypothetical protein